jgi:hypothetical protein
VAALSATAETRAVTSRAGCMTAWPKTISRAAAACKVMLAVIGPGWLTVTDRWGRPRLEDPRDIVRLEIEAALARDAWVIPILVRGAAMPGQQDLPESLADLAGRQAVSIRHESFSDDIGRLIRKIEQVVPSLAARKEAARRAEEQAVRQAEQKEAARQAKLDAAHSRVRYSLKTDPKKQTLKRPRHDSQ